MKGGICMCKENLNYDKEIGNQIYRLYENIRKLRNSEFTIDLSGVFDENKKEINETLHVSNNLPEKVGGNK